MRVAFRHLVPAAVTAAALLSLSGSAAGGPLVADVLLFSEYSVAGSGAAGVTLIGTAGVRLGMDPGLAKATSLNPLGGPRTIHFDGRPTYAGHTDGINKAGQTVGLDHGEGVAPGDLPARIIAEITEIDDLGINGRRDEGSGPTSDSAKNVDFKHKDATLTLAIPAGGGWNKLVLVEDAGLNAARLELCSDASCSNPTLLFDGFGASWKEGRILREALRTTPGFTAKDTDDPADQDQAWVFLLTEPLQGFLRITRMNAWGGQLELDFIGFGRNPRVGPTAVPQPGTLLLVVSGLLSLGVLVRRGQRPHRA
jgi:hypothetical protein